MMLACAAGSHCHWSPAGRTFVPGTNRRPICVQQSFAEIEPKLIGVGQWLPPQYAPAGMLVLHRAGYVMLDGGPRPSLNLR
jgi:hypothetical protein